MLRENLEIVENQSLVIANLKIEAQIDEANTEVVEEIEFLEETEYNAGEHGLIVK